MNVPTETVQIQLPDGCKGVTDEFGRHYTADDNRREVEIPQYTADALKKSGAVTKSRKLYGGFTLPSRG